MMTFQARRIQTWISVLVAASFACAPLALSADDAAPVTRKPTKPTKKKHRHVPRWLKLTAATNPNAKKVYDLFKSVDSAYLNESKVGPNPAKPKAGETADSESYHNRLVASNIHLLCGFFDDGVSIGRDSIVIDP